MTSFCDGSFDYVENMGPLVMWRTEKHFKYNFIQNYSNIPKIKENT